MIPPIDTSHMSILRGDGTWPWSAWIDGADIVVLNAKTTAFGGANDEGDNGETASGLSTRIIGRPRREASPVKVADMAKPALTALSDHTKAAGAPAIVRPLLDAITTLGAADAGELEHLLDARVAHLRLVEIVSACAAVFMFLAAVLYGIQLP